MNRPGAQTKPQTKPGAAKKRSLSTWLVRNLLLFVVMFVAATLLKSTYIVDWELNNNIGGNNRYIKQYPDLDMASRYSVKLGADFRFIDYIRQKTPEWAVVYIPAGDDFKEWKDQSGRPMFNGNLNNKLALTRFLYPRRVVLDKELGLTPYADSITHVGIANRRNHKMLPYKVDSTYTMGVLPVAPNP